MKVLVAGATGVIGASLVPSLTSTGHEVIKISRASGTDLLDREAVFQAVGASEPDAVVHMATAIPARVNPKKMDRDFGATNRLRAEGTRNLIDAAQQVGVRRIITQGLAYAYQREEERSSCNLRCQRGRRPGDRAGSVDERALAMKSKHAWTIHDLGEQDGRVAVITGANSGIGYEAAERLAAHGAAVILACRDEAKGSGAARRIAAAVPGSVVEVVRLDLASLASVHAAAEQLRSRYAGLDLLINNAGVMMPPFGRTEDGFETQFGTNHLGHFALTGLLLDRLLATPGSRVVTVSSFGHRPGRISLDDLNFEHRRYRPATGYAQSKLANLMFGYELQRRLAEAGATTISLAVEPGAVPTDLQRHANRGTRVVGDALIRMLGQPDAAAGALATLRAATDPAASGGEYYAPGGFLSWSGRPEPARSSRRSHDQDTQRRLWTESERLTGVTFDLSTTLRT